MSGYSLVLRIRALEERLDQFGFMMAHARQYGGSEYGDYVTIKPREERLPVYHRDAEIWTGTLEGLEIWLRGMEWAREYDMLLGVGDDQRRAKFEKRYLDKMERQRIKCEQKKILEILKTPAETLNTRNPK